MDETENTDTQHVIDLNLQSLSPALARSGEAIQAYNRSLMQAMCAVVGIPSYVWRGYATRREEVEAHLHYKLPDWVWTVEEQKRRTDGSGNGRIMRS